MADQTYTYHGPTSGVTLVLEDGTKREVMLFDGASVALPPQHPHVLVLEARGHLTAAPRPSAQAEPRKTGSSRSTRSEKES